MQCWRNLLGGFLLWTVHFFTVYIIASIFPGTTTAICLTVVSTLVMLVLTCSVAVRTFSADQHNFDGLQRWIYSLSLYGYALAGTAIIFQAIPAILH